MATAGQGPWQTMKVFESVAKNTHRDDPWCVDVNIDRNTLQALADGNRGALSLASTNVKQSDRAYNEAAKQYTQKLFTAVSATANNFYGKWFAIPMPEEPGGIDNNLKWINEDQKWEATWDAADSAFAIDNKFRDVSFFDSTGRTKTFAEWEYLPNRDFSGVGSAYADFSGNYYNQNEDKEYNINDHFGHAVGSDKNVASTSCNIVNSHYFINGKPYAIVNTDVRILEYDDKTTPDFGLTVLAWKFFKIDIPPENYIGPGKTPTQIQIPPKIVPPHSFGIAQQSSRYTWGPWIGGSLKGKSEVIVDDSLVPESFGNVDGMNQAGEALSNVGNAEMGASETGQVEIAEFPSYNIAERFAGSGPYVSDMSFTIDTSGFKTTYSFNTWTPQFGKLAKYNIDRISRINKASLEFLQRERSKIEKAPFLPIVQRSRIPEMMERLKANRTNAGFGLGQFFDTNNHIEASTVDLSDAASLAAYSDEKYKKSAGCSIDQQWTGYQTRKDKNYGNIQDRIMPGISQSNVSNEGDDDNKGILPNSEDLDPYFSTALIQGDDDGTKVAEKLDYIAAIIDVNDEKPEDIAFKQLQNDDSAKNITEIRSMSALKGPPMLSGWGYDIAYNPVPGNGINFSDDALEDRKYHPTGPMRLLWDAERGIWSGGPEILCGTLNTNITPASSPLDPTTFEVNVLRKDPGTGKGAGALEDRDEIITCYNRDTVLQAAAGENTWVMIIRVNYEWIPFWVSCA